MAFIIQQNKKHNLEIIKYVSQNQLNKNFTIMYENYLTVILQLKKIKIP